MLLLGTAVKVGDFQTSSCDISDDNEQHTKTELGGGRHYMIIRKTVDFSPKTRKGGGGNYRKSGYYMIKYSTRLGK
jgi:hypothetical protein